MTLRPLFAGVAAVTLLGTGPLDDAVADADTERDVRPAFSLTISPARLELSPRSEVVVKKVTAYNTGRAGLDVDVVLTGFEQLPNGEVVFGRPRAESDADWIKVRPQSFHLAPTTEQDVRVRIDLPADAEPGDHQIGLVFMVPADISAANLTLNRGVGAQMLIRAPGPVVRDVTLADIDLPSLSTGGDVPVQLTLKNAGTVHQDFFAPNNRIVGTAGDDRLPFPNLSVLAGVTRSVATSWSDPPWLCHCEVTVSLPNGHGGTSTVRAQVWIVPVYQILGAVLLLTGSVLLIRWRRRRRDAALAAARQQGYNEATKKTVEPIQQ